MKMTRRNFISASAATMLACGVSLSAHAAGSEAENNSLNFIADFFSDPSKPGTTQDATSFRKSEGQIAAMLTRAVGRGQRSL